MAFDLKKLKDMKVWMWYGVFAIVLAFAIGWAGNTFDLLAGKYLGPIVVAPVLAVLWNGIFKNPL